MGSVILGCPFLILAILEMALRRAWTASLGCLRALFRWIKRVLPQFVTRMMGPLKSECTLRGYVKKDAPPIAQFQLETTSIGAITDVYICVIRFNFFWLRLKETNTLCGGRNAPQHSQPGANSMQRGF